MICSNMVLGVMELGVEEICTRKSVMVEVGTYTCMLVMVEVEIYTSTSGLVVVAICSSMEREWVLA